MRYFKVWSGSSLYSCIVVVVVVVVVLVVVLFWPMCIILISTRFAQERREEKQKLICDVLRKIRETMEWLIWNGEKGRPYESSYLFWCKSGKHRSVALARLAASLLGYMGFEAITSYKRCCHCSHCQHHCVYGRRRGGSSGGWLWFLFGWGGLGGHVSAQG